MCRNDLLFFGETCELKMSECVKYKFSCKNFKICLTWFFCFQKCHVECASKNKSKLNLYKQGDYKFYCDKCKESVFPFQNVNNVDYDCFYESVKPIISEINSEKYLDLYSVKFNNKNCIHIVFMNKEAWMQIFIKLRNFWV